MTEGGLPRIEAIRAYAGVTPSSRDATSAVTVTLEDLKDFTLPIKFNSEAVGQTALWATEKLTSLMDVA